MGEISRKELMVIDIEYFILSDLPNGVYLVALKTEKGNLYSRFVKE
jgi:hypothetical protein